MKQLKKLQSSILGLDIYGHPIHVHFRGETTYKTWFGVLCTLFVYAIVAQSMIVLGRVFIDGSRQDEKVTIQKFDRHESDRFYLKEQGIELYVFAYSLS